MADNDRFVSRVNRTLGNDADLMFKSSEVGYEKLYRKLMSMVNDVSELTDEKIKEATEELFKKEQELDKKRSLAAQIRDRESKKRQIEAQREIGELEEAHLKKLYDNQVKDLRRLNKEKVKIEKKATAEIENILGKKSSSYEKRKSDIDRYNAKLQELEKQFVDARLDGDNGKASLIAGQMKMVNSYKETAERQQRRDERHDQVLSDLVSSVRAGINAINSRLNSLYTNQVKFNARTTSSDDAYGSMLKELTDVIGASPFIKQNDVIENLNKLADTGSNYNIEQRAYLATLANDIASTFDVTSEELLRLNRLLRTDLTASRMGMVQNLTAALNSTFNDSSFMNNLRQSVASGVIDASSQLSSGKGTEFEWAVQSWMGALTSAGMSSDVISMLTQGLNYLGSGNVSAMSGNEQLQTLFALMASNAGMSYSDMLVNGIDASDVNSLMKEMVSYLKDISEENKVVQSEMFRILGMGGLANMTALNNIDVRTISNLASNPQTNINTDYYSTSSLLNRVNVVKENLTTTIAADIGESAARLTTWIVADLLDSLVGGIKIPSAFVLGSGINIDSSVAELMKAGVIATDIVGIGKSIGGAIKNGGIADYGAFTQQAGSMGRSGFGTSLSYAVGSSSLADIKSSSLAGQANEAKKNQKTVKGILNEKDIDLEQDVHDMRGYLKQLYSRVDDEKPIIVEDKAIKDIAELIKGGNMVQKIEGTVTLNGFSAESEKTMNNVLVNALALYMKWMTGGGEGFDANGLSISSGDGSGYNGMFGNEFAGHMSFADFLNRIISSNSQTMEQISEALTYFNNQNSMNQYMQNGYIK